MYKPSVAALACLLVFHSPDGSELLVEKSSIRIVKPIGSKHHDHIAAGTSSVVYTGVRPNGFGITESTKDVVRMLASECGGR